MQGTTFHSATLASLVAELAELLQVVDDADALPAAIAGSVRSLIPASVAYISAFDIEGLPRNPHLYPDSYQIPDSYRDELFALDPFYSAYHKGQRGSLWLREAMPPGFESTAYFKQFYASEGLVDELLHLIALPSGGVMGVGIVRSQRGGGVFTESERALHATIFPVVERAIEHLAKLLLARAGDVDSRMRREEIDAALQRFGAEELTAREREVIYLVLRGHNTQSIAVELGISPDTVKLHRKHSYAKLHVSSQGELFNRFLESIGLDR